jgi:hypothetical protein
MLGILFVYIYSYIQLFMAACHTAAMRFNMDLRTESWNTYKEQLVNAWKCCVEKVVT